MSAMTLSAELSANFLLSVSKLTLPNSSNSLPVNKHDSFHSIFIRKLFHPPFSPLKKQRKMLSGDKLLAPSKKSKMPTKPNSNASKNESSPKRGRNQGSQSEAVEGMRSFYSEAICSLSLYQLSNVNINVNGNENENENVNDNNNEED